MSARAPCTIGASVRTPVEFGAIFRAGPATSRHGGARGVTLVEVIIALGLALTLLATVFVFVQDLLRARDRIERMTARERSMDVFLEAVEQATISCVLDAGGVDGDAMRCTIWSASTDPARLAMAGESPYPASVSTSFGFEEGDGSLRIRRGDGAEEALPAELFVIRFRYHDGFEWVDEFDGRLRRRLPAAIEISLWSAPWPASMRPSWMPEAAPIDEEPSEGSNGNGTLAAFRADPPTPLDDDASPDTPQDRLSDRGPAGIASDREMAQAPAPERRRVITVPDSAPAALMPISIGGKR